MPAIGKTAIKAITMGAEKHRWFWCQSAYSFVCVESVKTKNRKDYVVCYILGSSAMDRKPKKIEPKLDDLVGKGLYPLLQGSVYMGMLERDLRALLDSKLP
jgi:hypothetical protein